MGDGTNTVPRPGKARPTVEPLGVTELFSPPGDDPEITADLVFVHGLQGHPQRTWQYGTPPAGGSRKGNKKKSFVRLFPSKSKKSQLSDGGNSASGKDHCYWPADLIPEDFPSVRVLTYGYDSHISHFFKGAVNQMTITQHGRQLLQRISNARSDCRGRPLIFVAHSLGGILVKEAIIASSRYTYQPDLKDLGESCYAVFFFGTPHLGADIAEWGLILRRIVNIVPLGFSTYDGILRGLVPDSENLSNIERDFNHILNDPPKEEKIRIYSFREGRGLVTLNQKAGFYTISFRGIFSGSALI